MSALGQTWSESAAALGGLVVLALAKGPNPEAGLLLPSVGGSVLLLVGKGPAGPSPRLHQYVLLHLVGEGLESPARNVAQILYLGRVHLPLGGTDPCGPGTSEAPA